MSEKQSKRPSGLYEEPVSRALRRELAEIEAGGGDVERRDLSGTDSAHLLARSLHHRLVHALTGLTKIADQVELTNSVIALLAERASKSGARLEDQIDAPFEELRGLLMEQPKGLAEARLPVRPSVPLSMSELLVNSRHDLSIGPEIKKELASADRVDLLCSFLKWSGFRVLEPAIREFLERRPGKLRVLTTAYMGATERRALDAFSKLGAQVKVSLDTRRTRLHAKAWLFHRDSGFTTAFVGSSNLSAAAMLDGMEWNVRLSHQDNSAIVRKFQTTIEHYWSDVDFQDYAHDIHAEIFDEAIRNQKQAHQRILTALKVYPRPHQVEILDELAAERDNGHKRNLVVAATGTGKTVVAALDYQRLRKQAGRDLRLLFVAHRREIIDQSMNTFQAVLGDPAFGERLIAGDVPVKGNHVFASVQSLSEERLSGISPDAYDVLIVDEFHHAAAPTYERLLQHFEPQILLGLTATPERTDGKSVLGWFDGRIASELRLWKALDQDLLVPFQYFGVSDGTNLRDVKWTPKGYDSASLRALYTGGHRWADLVIREVERKVADVTKMKAIGFCVDIAHAEFMADRFNAVGIPSVAVSSKTSQAERENSLRKLTQGGIRVIFCVDLFNEGVDIPHIDTVLFLRPTESATVFLQQLGRGLRHAENKDCLTVLDFIGYANKRFRFDARFRAILGGTRRQIQRQVERGFPLLPSGCSINLDRHAQNAIVENIQASLGLGHRGLAEDLAGLGPDTSLASFLRHADVDLEDIYDRPGRCWTSIRRQAGFSVGAGGPRRAKFENALSRMLHVDDNMRIQALGNLLSSNQCPVAREDDWVQRDLFVLLGLSNEPLAAMNETWRELWGDEDIRDELTQLLALLGDRLRHLSFPLEGNLPLRVHATYSLDEVLAVLNERDRRGAIRRLREGVFYSENLNSDFLFVTLEKSEGEYSPSTMYNDYPISPTRFHWESQSNTHAETRTGQRYIHHSATGGQVYLFVRQRKKDERGITTPYVFLGPCCYVEHAGERPMQIIWEMERPMPSWLYQEVKVAAG